MSKGANKSPESSAGSHRCLTCEATAINRGLCRTCYTAAYRAVGKKETTWKKLERRGFALPKGARRKVVSRWKKAISASVSQG